MSDTRDVQTILVVDDEPLMLHLAAAILHRAGYEVLRARSGAEALAAFFKSTVRIQLLLAAVAMPNMGGPYLADLLRERDPELRVLLMTGVDDREAAKARAQRRGFQTLQQPFTTTGLLDAVRSELEKPQARSAT